MIKKKCKFIVCLISISLLSSVISYNNIVYGSSKITSTSTSNFNIKNNIVNKSSNSSNSSNTRIVNYKELAQSIVSNIHNGNVKTLVDNLEQPMPNIMNIPILLNKITKPLGSYIGTSEKITEVGHKNSTSISIYGMYDKGAIKHIFHFNKDGKITGYYFNTAPNNQEKGNFIYNDKTTDLGDDTLVTFGENKISGLFTTPNSPEITNKKTLVILITGSGPNNLDAQINELKPFKDISKFLVENGYTTFRFNKVTYEQAEYLDGFNLENEYFNDVASAIKLSKNKFKDYKIILLGHSQGAMLLPNFYINNKDDIAGLISVAGTDKTLFDVLIEQNTAIKEDYIKKGDRMSAAYIEQAIEEIKEFKNLKKDDGKTRLAFPNEYIISLNKNYNPNYYKEIKIPFLGIHGDKDFQVKVDDLKSIEGRLKGNEKAKFIVIQGMNHMLVPSEELPMMEDYKNKRNVETFLKELKTFLDENFNK